MSRGIGARWRLAVGTVVLALGVGLTGPVTTALAVPPSEPLTTWAASADRTSTRISGQTVRNVMTVSTGGRGLQVSLSNAFGDAPVTLARVALGLVESGATLHRRSAGAVTFAGSGSVTIPAGGEVLSDPIRPFLDAGTTIAVSIYIPGDVRRPTGHNLALTDNYLSVPGDHTLEEGGASYTRTIDNWAFVQSLVVGRGLPLFTVAALGDSITDGFGSTPNANHRWTDYLAERISTRPPPGRPGVANEGISGNRVLSGGFGQSARQRFDRDVLGRAGVETAILLEGINDINTGSSADQLIAGYRQLISRAHAQDVCLLGGTLTPNEGGGADAEARRQAVNDFVRTSGEFDGVIDFDAALRDPTDPRRFLDAYDSGDGLHPGDAGYEAMAAAVPLRLLECTR